MSAENELMEILPAYEKYVNAKRLYQMKQTDDVAMVEYMELLCYEISDFMMELYAGTSTRKERHHLEETALFLYNKFSE